MQCNIWCNIGGEPPRIGCESPSNARRISGTRGEHIQIVDRLLSFTSAKVLGSTVDIAEQLSGELKDVLGDDPDAWEDVRAKVRAFTPDGAPDEQLAGRFAAGIFENMALVARCSAHAAASAMKNAWKADSEVERATKVVKEVA